MVTSLTNFGTSSPALKTMTGVVGVPAVGVRDERNGSARCCVEGAFVMSYAGGTNVTIDLEEAAVGGSDYMEEKLREAVDSCERMLLRVGVCVR